jgi:hypothetical protein
LHIIEKPLYEKKRKQKLIKKFKEFKKLY